MIIAVSQRVVDVYFSKADCLEHEYTQLLSHAGAIPLVVPNTLKDVYSFLLEFPIGGILLTGGNTIEPKKYGGQDHGEKDISSERDNTEEMLLRYAVEKNIPVLGICRGCQFINIFFSGKITKNTVENERCSKHVNTHHEIIISESSAKKLLNNPSLVVNSFHSYVISQSDVSPQLHIFAESKEDKTVEAIYHPKLPIVGIMWHPERDKHFSGETEKIIRAFVQHDFYWKQKEK